MKMINIIATAGGLFAFLTFVHFFADWLFQSQREANGKHKSWKIRARHCTVYTLFFVLPILLLTQAPLLIVVSLAILWVSHFIIDTYIPVFLWAKHLRRIPVLNDKGTPIKGINTRDHKSIFKHLWTQPVYPILFIAVDQILHLAFLWPVILIILL